MTTKKVKHKNNKLYFKIISLISNAVIYKIKEKL